MVAGDGGHHQVLRLGVAQKFPVADQVPGVLVVRGDVDLLAAGVELGRGPEQLAALAAVTEGSALVSNGSGVVQATSGLAGRVLTSNGATAGTMPMPMRRDSFRAAARFALAVADIGENHDGVTTVGAVACKPGVVTAVAGETTITLDMRHIDAGELAAMYSESIAAAHAAAEAEGCTVEFEHIFRIPPMPFHPELLEAARMSVREVEGHDVELPSGALHDASEMARSIPTVMIFSSSIAGLSHTKEEDTSDEHLFMAVDAFNRTCRRTIQLMVDGKL